MPPDPNSSATRANIKAGEGREGGRKPKTYKYMILYFVLCLYL